MIMSDFDVASSIRAVERAVAEAARRAGRDPEAVKLVAVSKTVPELAIEEAIGCGQRRFGENRVQEAKSKWPRSASASPRTRAAPYRPAAVEQGARRGALFDVIETVDREDRRSVAERSSAQGAPAPLRAGEHRRGAAEGRRLPARRTPSSRSAATSYGLAIEGLMCIPPADEEPAPHFALLAKIAARSGCKN